jgi:transposase
MVSDRQDRRPAGVYPQHVSRHGFASFAADLGYSKPTIASLLRPRPTAAPADTSVRRIPRFYPQQTPWRCHPEADYLRSGATQIAGSETEMDDSRAQMRPLGGGGDKMKTRNEVSAILRLKARGWGSRRIAAKLHCSRNTVRRWLAQGQWCPRSSRSRSVKLDGLSGWLRERFHFHAGNTGALRRELAAEKNAIVSQRTVERAVAPLWRELAVSAQARQAAFEWMRSVLQKDIDPEVLHREVGSLPEIETLLRHLYNGRLSDRNRSMVVIASCRGLNAQLVCNFLGISKNTRRKYLRSFRNEGCKTLFSRQIKVARKFEDERLKLAVFGLLHEPPSNYSINRTTWIMSDLTRVLRETGHPACAAVIRKITKTAGYRWRKARVALTSSDPNYTEKLGRIRSILSRLGSDEAFFSIDEFGPFAVKMTPGRKLSTPGEQRVVPQWQKSRGCMIMIAALELSGNQVTHFYSPKKNTVEMVRMMECLVQQYGDRRKLYLSWDAASWHISKSLHRRITDHNAAIIGGSYGPTVETAPLPAGAQFLNVVESVFSGMARSIIHNSDYKTLDDAKAAIDRYFADRNAHFAEHPRRAGKKIWGEEREAPEFSLANNCKDPRYR